MTAHGARPIPAVLDAFGVDGPVTPLSGGLATAWRCGDTVFKSLDLRLDELEWLDRVLVHEVRSESVRWTTPLRTRVGAIVVADALVIEGATAALLESFADVPDFVQCLLRALRFRIVADHVRGGGARDWGLPDPYASAAELACARAD